VLEVTRILSEIEAGNPAAAQQLFPLVYDELRKLAAAKMAAERPDHTLQATALVHEAYVRLVESDQPWESRAHFYAAAANSMRQILVSWARGKHASKRGGDRQRVDMDDLALLDAASPEMILDVDALLARLTEVDTEAAELVKLRLYGGLSVSEAGRVLGLSRTVAYENWHFARAWFSAHWSDLDEK
jgi:RNA polymerase sigma factor (TIGR02999 family)